MIPWKSPRRSFSQPPFGALSLLPSECASVAGPVVDPALAGADTRSELGRSHDEYAAGEALLQRLRESGL